MTLGLDVSVWLVVGGRGFKGSSAYPSRESWKGIGLPSTFVLDPAGVIRYEAYGAVNWDRADVVAAFTALMDEPEADDVSTKE